jgi:hypothetical protein
LSGVVQVGSLGVAAAKTKTGAAVIGKAKAALGIGAQATTAGAVSGTAPAVAGTAGAGTAPAVTGTTAGTTAAPSVATGGSAAGGAATTTLGAVAGFGAVAAGGAAIANKLYHPGKPGGQTEQATGAAGGAAAGALYGSVIPGIGTLVGGLVGGIVGAASSASVICHELTVQGYLDPYVDYLDGEYRKQYIDDATYAGYIKWAPTVVGWMQKSKIVTQIARPFGVGWAHHMAHQLDDNVRDSKLGWLLLKVGAPICKVIGGEYGILRRCR